MLDLTKPVQTMDGRKARIICTNAMIMHIGEQQRNIIALVTELNGEKEHVHMYYSDGRMDWHSNTYNDLKNVPIKVTKYMIVSKSYPKKNCYSNSVLYESRGMAEGHLQSFAADSRILEVTWEE